MKNPISTPRIVVSPRATALAALVAPLVEADVASITIRDTELTTVGLTLDGIYRALRELRELGALTSFHTVPSSGVRYVQADRDSWVWAAVAAVTATGTAAV